QAASRRSAWDSPYPEWSVVPLTTPSTSSRNAAMVASVSASTFSRSSSSVLDGRRLNHQVPVLTVSPSSSSVLTPGRPANTRLTCSVEAAWSATSELISPLATYLAYLASNCDNGSGCSPKAASVCKAARSPESANQKSLK